jgi:hypothetical protein
MSIHEISARLSQAGIQHVVVAATTKLPPLESWQHNEFNGDYVIEPITGVKITIERATESKHKSKWWLSVYVSRANRELADKVSFGSGILIRNTNGTFDVIPAEHAKSPLVSTSPNGCYKNANSFISWLTQNE